MTSLNEGDGCQPDDPINLFPIESLRFPLDSTMQIVFTGYFNGFGVEVRSGNEVALLHHMGCFGKGSASRSKPRVVEYESRPTIIRKRQFLKRSYWSKKFDTSKEAENSDVFFKDVDKLTGNILRDTERKPDKNIIDLVSSDEESQDNNDVGSNSTNFQCHEKQDLAIIVPNSDSEEENYFKNLRPYCCVNKIKIEEKLMLTLQEAFFLKYALGSLQIVNMDHNMLNVESCWKLFMETDNNFVLKYVVYHYFRSKGYIVKPGIKFGGDYLLYKEGPGVTHANYIVVIKNLYDNVNNWVSILGHVRMAVTTVKEILIAEVNHPKQDILLPKDLSSYSVREILLTRKLPITINEDVD